MLILSGQDARVFQKGRTTLEKSGLSCANCSWGVKLEVIGENEPRRHKDPKTFCVRSAFFVS